ncbi:hypothetical protein [Desertivirga arenae]|uniref:hypothetical protein n=1 Tax=Desertivirga arenae TaxID=2810309 RepID=UPI001A978BE4|nr:hypothetical protein [Pedobacter sp. SYSU D00823]
MNTNPVLVLAICILPTLASCRKDDKDKVSPIFTAKIDGILITSPSPQVASFYVSPNSLEVQGHLTPTTGIAISMGNPRVGTFVVGSGEIYVSYWQITNFDVIYLGKSGMIKITEWSSKRLRGTFEFVANRSEDWSAPVATKVISEGKFDMEVKKF